MSYALDMTAAAEIEATTAAVAPLEAAAPWIDVPTVADAGPLDTVEIQDEDKELLDRLAADDRIPLDRAQLDALLDDKEAFVGAAGRQVADVIAAAEKLIADNPEAANYVPAPIL